MAGPILGLRQPMRRQLAMGRQVTRGPCLAAAALVASMLIALVSGMGMGVAWAQSPGVLGDSPIPESPAEGPAGEIPAGYWEVWRQVPFGMDRLLEAWPLPVDAFRDDLLILGRNYESREVRLLRVSWKQERLEVVWRSSNFFQWASPVAIAVGNFRGLGSWEVVVVTNDQTRLLAPAGTGFEEVWRAPNPLGETWGALVLPEPGQERHRLGLVRLAAVESLLPVKEVVWYAWEEQGWRMVGSGPRLVSVRSIAPLALDARAQQGLVVDRGVGTQAGRIEVWVPRGGGWQRLSSQPLRPAAVFALAGGQPRRGAPGTVVIGDHRGRVGLYQWADGGLKPLAEPVPVGWGLVDVALADMTGDGVGDIVVLGNPNRVHLLSPQRWLTADGRR